MKKHILFLFLLVNLTNGFSQTGVMDNFDDNILDPNWNFSPNAGCPTCYTGTETNSELKVTASAVGVAYENFSFSFASINLTVNPVVKINVKNAAAFNMRIDLTDINGNATNASPNVKAIPISASYVQYTFDFTGKFNQNTPTVAAVDQTKIVTAVIFVNPGGPAFSNTIYLNDLIIGNPAAPVAGFTQSAPSICTSTPLTFTNTSSNGVTSYAWNFGAGATPATATTFGPQSVTWSTAGTKTVSLIVTGPGGTDSLKSSFTVNGFPSAAGTITGATALCNGSSATYSLTAVAGATGYSWSLPTGANITAGANTNSVTITFGTTGGNVSVKGTNGCGNGPASPNLAIAVNAVVTAGVSIAASPSNSICAGNSVTFTATPTNGGTTPNYQWKLNNTNVGTNGPSNTYTTSTLVNGDKVSVQMTSNAACVLGSPASSAQITMIVSSGAAPTISISTTTPTICSGSILIFTTSVTNGGPSPVFSWKQNGITLLGENNDSLFAITVNDQDVFSAVVTASGCASGSAPSNLYTITVTPGSLANVYALTPSDTVCVGMPTTFTATPVNGGTSPVYQWQVNGVNAGTNNTIFTTSTLANNDIVTVRMTSNSTAACLQDNPATSTPLTMKVVSTMTSAVKISSSATTICGGLPVTFTATPLRNGGASPTYQWKINGVNQAGQTASTFTSSTLTNANVVTCVMTSSISCAQPSTSNAITITVTTTVVPSVAVTTTPSTSVCAGSSATFTANPTNGGSAPTYQWKINSVDQGAVLPTFTPPSPLANNDVISVVMTSNLSCASTPTATSPGVTITVNPMVAPAVAISATATTICPGTSVTFTAVPTFGGAAPTYLWKTNGIPNGATSAVYTVANLINNDAITCEMTSNDPCRSTNTVTSNPITMIVTPAISASVIISSSPVNACPSTPTTFTAIPTNPGSAAVYQWKLNGSPVGTNSLTYSNSTLVAGSVVSVVMTSNAACVIGSPATSNLVTVSPAVNATISISASANPVCSGTTVNFTSSITGGGTVPTYVWKKMGTIIPSATSATYSYVPVNGDVITCVMTSNAVCAVGSPVTSSPITITVTAVPAITVNITPPTSSICGGSSATFTATPGNAGTSPSYQWQINGQNVGSNIPTFSSTTLANNDAVQVVMTSSAACVGSTATSNIVTMVVSNPPSTANAGSDQFVTTNTATLSATPPASGIGAWSTSGSATITSPGNTNSSVTNLSTGANIFTWTVTSGICPPSSDAVTINLGSKPTTKSITGPINVIVSTTGITYSIPTQAGSSYSWIVSGATLASGQGTNSITVDFGSTPGSADIFVTEFNNYGNYTATLHVNTGVIPSQKTITGPGYAVVNSTGIAYSIPATGGSTYSWTVTGATPTSGTSNIISLNFGSSVGPVTLSVTETNTYGSMTATKTVTVGTLPATPVISGPDSVVTSTTVIYSVALNAGSTYSWQVPANATMTGITTNSVSVTFTQSGSYSLVVTETNASGPATGTKIGIKVGTVATVSSITGTTTVQAGVTYTYTAITNAGGNSIFYWTFSPTQPTIVSGAGTNIIKVIFPAGTTNETITVTQDNGFGTSTVSLPITVVPNGLISYAHHNSLSYTMYPNPFSDGVNLTFNTAISSNLSLSICNMNGEIIFSSNEYSTNEQIVLGRDLPVGLYIIKAITDDKVQVIKINKE